MKEYTKHIMWKKVKAIGFLPFYLLTFLLLMTSCSMTKGIPEDDQLFTGLKKIVYSDEKNYDNEAYDDHLITTKEEVEAALATEPNGSLFGSSYYTVPWSWHLWVYNKYAGKESAFAKWMTKSFGKSPVLMSKVNPALRASVPVPYSRTTVTSVVMSPTSLCPRRIPRSVRSVTPSVSTPSIRSTAWLIPISRHHYRN